MKPMYPHTKTNRRRAHKATTAAVVGLTLTGLMIVPLAGCGGGGGSHAVGTSGSGTTASRAAGSLHLSIAWPEQARTRLIPTNTKRLELTFTSSTIGRVIPQEKTLGAFTAAGISAQSGGEVLVITPPAGGTTNVDIVVPEGDYTAEVKAYDTATSGSGKLLGSVTKSISVLETGNNPPTPPALDLAIESVIKTLTLTRADGSPVGTLDAGLSVQLKAAAQDASGADVPIDQSAITWSVSNTSKATVSNATADKGKLTAVRSTFVGGNDAPVQVTASIDVRDAPQGQTTPIAVTGTSALTVKPVVTLKTDFSLDKPEDGSVSGNAFKVYQDGTVNAVATVQGANPGDILQVKAAGVVQPIPVTNDTAVATDFAVKVTVPLSGNPADQTLPTALTIVQGPASQAISATVSGKDLTITGATVTLAKTSGPNSPVDRAVGTDKELDFTAKLNGVKATTANAAATTFTLKAKKSGSSAFDVGTATGTVNGGLITGDIKFLLGKFGDTDPALGDYSVTALAAITPSGGSPVNIGPSAAFSFTLTDITLDLKDTNGNTKSDLEVGDPNGVTLNATVDGASSPTTNTTITVTREDGQSAAGQFTKTETPPTGNSKITKVMIKLTGSAVAGKKYIVTLTNSEADANKFSTYTITATAPPPPGP